MLLNIINNNNNNTISYVIDEKLIVWIRCNMTSSKCNIILIILVLIIILYHVTD